MSDPQNKLSGRPSSNLWIHFTKKQEEKSKGCYSTQCKKECLRQINDDNNNENLESSTTQQPISNFY
nr:12004_t:CDS:2 [Entrophospora candida]